MTFDEMDKRSEKNEGNPRESPMTDPLSESLYSKLEARKKKLIFILEDFPPTVAFYKRLLTGYNLTDTGTVDEAIKAIDKIKQSGGKIDIMISDFNLPDGLSVKAIEHMREAFSDVKIILVSGNEDAESFAKVDKFISKDRAIDVKEAVDEFL